MKRRTKKAFTLGPMLALSTAIGQALAAPAAQIAEQDLSATTLWVTPQINYQKALLRVSGPEGYALSQSFANGQVISTDLLANAKADYEKWQGGMEKADALASLLDGRYNYEVVFTTEAGEQITYQSLFFVENGRTLSRSEMAAFAADVGKDAALVESTVSGDLMRKGPATTKTLAEPEWITILDATNGDSFLSFDSDTPTADAYWSLHNDNGELSVVENDNFTPTDGDGSNRMTFERGGEIGIGTTAPSATLDLAVSDPEIEFDDGGGITWTLDGDSANFYIYDSEPGYEELFTIESGSSNTGFGTFSPTAPLHVFRSNGTAQILVAEDSSAAGDQVMFSLSRPGSTGKVRFLMSTADGTWTFDNNGTEFTINKTGGAGVNEFIVEADGDGRFRGRSFATQHVNTSSREVKTAFHPVDEATVLDKLAKLDISQWRYKQEPDTARHIGPVAEQFHQVFGLGDGKHISTVDADGIAFAAIQALEAENEALQSQNADLEARLAEVENILSSIK